MDRSDEILAAITNLGERVTARLDFIGARLDGIEVRLSRVEARTELLCQKLLSPAEQHAAGVLPAAFSR